MAVERIESGSLSGGGKDGDWEWLYVSVLRSWVLRGRRGYCGFGEVSLDHNK
jgi:hypothetical protein